MTIRVIFVLVVVSMLGGAAPLLAQAAKDAGTEVRIDGCVQLEKDHSQKDHEFVLTMVKPEGDRKATVYAITGGREKELGRRVGQQIEVIGVIEDEGKANGDVPRIKMTAWVPLKDSCPAQ